LVCQCHCSSYGAFRGFPYRTLKHSATVNCLSNRSGLLLVGEIHIHGRAFLDEAQLAVWADAIHSEKVELIRIPGDSTSLPREARRYRSVDQCQRVLDAHGPFGWFLRPNISLQATARSACLKIMKRPHADTCDRLELRGL
jgi:hypothetical protein